MVHSHERRWGNRSRAVGRRFCNSSCALPGFRQTDTVGIVDQPSGRFIWKWELVIGYGTLKRLVDAREQASADTELSSNLQAKNYFSGTCSGSKYGGVSRERLGMSTAPGAHRGVGVVPSMSLQGIRKRLKKQSRAMAEAWIVGL